MTNHELITHKKSVFEVEADMRLSMEGFLMEHVYPRLPKQTKSEIDLYISRNVSITGAFELAEIKTSSCERGPKERI